MTQRSIFIAGQNVDLTVLTEEDARDSSWFDWFNDPRATRYLQKHHFPNSREEQVEYFLTSVIGQTERIQLGLQVSGDLVGVISLNDIEWINRKAEISLVIGSEQHRRMKVSLEAMSLLIAHGFDTLNLHRIYGGTIASDWATLLVRALGFRSEGVFRGDVYKDGCYCDVYFVGLLKEEFKPFVPSPSE